MIDIKVAAFLNNGTFDELLIRVGNDDVESIKNNNAWLQNHPAEAIIFSNPGDRWDKIKNIYRTTFTELVLGELPSETNLVNTLKEIYSRLGKVKCAIE